MVRDPQFWKRFSVAVHQDDLEKQDQYVSPSSSPLASPTSQSHLSPTFPPMAQLSPFRSSFVPTPTSSTPSWTPHKAPRSNPQRPHSKLQKTPSTKPLLRPSIPDPAETVLSPPLSPFLPSPSRSFFRTPNLSTFSLSGRPPSRFNFTTTITADASHRSSWLARQKKKERHRTWLCWCFWVVFLLLVAGVVVTVLILKGKGII